MPTPETRAHLLISCPDRTGVVAAVTQLLWALGANIVDSQQHTEAEDDRFFMRLAFDLEGLGEGMDTLRQAFEPVAQRFEMRWQLTQAARPKRVALFVSKQDHCAIELLWLWKRQELHAELPFVIGNHPEAADWTRSYGIDFHHVPVTPDTKAAAEARQMELLRDRVDLVVLARYMQILSADFLEALAVPVINIHHSFLPAFIGANPYAQARRRGVKLIGATAHYVTAELDAGPIIEQDVHRVGHRHEVEDLVRLGRQVERQVLARAVAAHLEDRVLVHGNRTVVFD